MQPEIALLIGVLFTVATHLLLQRSFVSNLFGFLILSNASNLVVLAMSGRPDGKSAPVVFGANTPMVDPLPQALILTAIVIGFGMAAYLVFLLYRLFLDQKTTNAAELYQDREIDAEKPDPS